MGVEQTLAEKTGSEDLVARCRAGIRPLVDEEGYEAYLQVADLFSSFDLSLTRWVLESGERLLTPLRDTEGRKELLGVINGMGRSRWSVAAVALKTVPEFSRSEPRVITQWLKQGAAIAEIDQDAAVQYFEASASVFAHVGEEHFSSWASLGAGIARKSWKSAKEYFRASPQVVRKIDVCHVETWARIGIHLIEKSPRVKAGYNAQSLLAVGAGAGKSKSLELAIQYFKSAPQILGRLSIQDLREWVEKGLEDGGEQKAFFSLSTGKSRMAVEGLVKGLELKDIHVVLASYAESLMERRVLLRSSSLFYKNLPGLSRFLSVTDGARVFLPPKIAIFEDEDMNFSAYKAALCHELAHLLFGTFDLDRSALSALSESGDPALAFKIFEYLEDERVDFLMGREYPGLERDRQVLMREYLEQRDDAETSLFEAVSFGDLTGPVGVADDFHAYLAEGLGEARERVREEGVDVRGVLGIATEVTGEVERFPGEASCGRVRSHDRLFYRGTIDFDLVDQARAGMALVLSDLTERLRERKKKVPVEYVEEALRRVEDTEGLEPETLLWQAKDGEQRDELFQHVQQILEDMEAERLVRRTAYYDEWDHRLEDYKKEWCRVRELDMPSTNPGFYTRTVEEHYGIVSLLRKHFGLLRPDRVKRIFREERGDDIDYDALVESVVERQAGVTPSDRVYIRREKNLRDVSVAFLVDMSYSTGDELASGKRIIDVEKEGLVVMAEALESIGDAWAVYGFSTSKRDRVDFYVIRDFRMAFGDDVKMRYENIRPMAQTRLGAAIRHATSLLKRQHSKVRLLILLSDGRPYDVDYGDAAYAVEDTRRALWEGRRLGINSFCITVDKKSRDYLPYMYGEANYTLIDNVETLPATMPLIYKKLTT